MAGDKNIEFRNYLTKDLTFDEAHTTPEKEAARLSAIAKIDEFSRGETTPMRPGDATPNVAIASMHSDAVSDPGAVQMLSGVSLES
ncbi:MAG TPA: hypothetical protein V6D17_01475 [Candidatus Obscuribacterales bacterium]